MCRQQQDVEHRRHLIAQAMDKVGKDGVITVEEGSRPGYDGRDSWKACSSTRATCQPPLRHRPRSGWNAILEDLHRFSFTRRRSRSDEGPHPDPREGRGSGPQACS